MTNSETGRQIGLYDHIRQSIKNILFTRIGTPLAKWEPRIEIQAASVSAANANDAKVIINIEAVNISTGTLETYSIRK